MSILGMPVVADAIARLAQLAPGPRLAAEVSFAELPARTETVTVPTRHGDLPAVVYRPADSGVPAPVYVNLHGGGFVMRHPEQDDPLCRYLAANAGAVVINVDYDVAPRHRFPVALEEAYDAVGWAAGPGHGWDGTRLCVGGQSAGGALAAGTARLALELGGPEIALQVLHYPPLDLATMGRGKHTTERSPLSAAMEEVFDTVYIPSPPERRNRLASPAWGPNGDGIAGIAPALVITCEFDRLHDEGAAYAAKLVAAGSLAEHLDIPGAAHGYNLLGRDRALVENAYALIAKHVIAATATTRRAA
ncbi:MAG TPA: alpha/beta hydrolase fold domain-containing protein [Trebonia sp.]